MEKVKDLSTGRWYMEQTLANGWSRNVLTLQIGAKAHVRHGKTVSNFAATLPAPQSVLDFVTLSEPFHERELETQLVRHLEAFLLALGQGFAFVGRQYRLDLGDDDFYIAICYSTICVCAFSSSSIRRKASSNQSTPAS